MDNEQELGGESYVVWVRSDDEWSVGVVQEDAEEGLERTSGESGRDGGCWSEEEMVGEDGPVEGDVLDNTRTQDLSRR